MSTDLVLLVFQVVCTLAMVGVIWFVQLVHYPLYAAVGEAEFGAYQAEHVRRTGWGVIPFMLGELGTALAALRYPGPASTPEVVFGLALLALIWGSTFLLQVPRHERLAQGRDLAAARSLVTTNWLRTFGWSARGALVVVLLVRALRSPAT